ncbi:MFS transporter [Kineococcus rhizosphaerae]|uniref:Putative MFS family arabinose efflux permease n=1 Tax=Kineococcus rhizosphaerae TaxID=559628 RepID=A0A2T0R0J5_9ACTN|nr:MFS transporter [Kineococcus rhizosphaerae]PRY12832.1 putative MFS family arabinose efflux permease [Kineococcus rhizosphaerae]
MNQTFRSLRHRDYRLWVSGAVVSNVGTWMQRVAQDWLVIQVLTHGSGTAGGITTGLQFGPILLLAPIAGTIADRFPQRRTLMVTQSVMGFLGLVMAALVLSGHVQLWHVYVLAVLLGCASAIDGPVRQTFVGQLVPREDLPNAIGLNSASFNSARLIGPALAGVLIAWIGTGPVFLLNALSFVAPLVMLHLMRPVDPVPREKPAKGTGGMREGLRYVRARPDLVAIFALVAVVGTFGLNFQLTSALMTSVKFGTDSAGYGLAGTVLAVGSLAGALVAARRDRPRYRLVVGAAVAFGVLASLAALMPTYALYLVVLPFMGLASLTLLTAANATVQMSTEPAVRGRVMALYMSLMQGGTVVGGPFVGWVGTAFGPQWSILVGSIPSALVGLAVGWFFLRRARVRVRYSWRGTPHLRLVPAAPAPDGDRDPAAA